MDELRAEPGQQDVRRERLRYQLAAYVVIGMPLLAVTITVSAVLILKLISMGSEDEWLIMIAVGNAVLAAVGSGVGVWIEPGNRPQSKITGLLGGCVFGFLVYFALSAVALAFVDLFRR